METQHRYVGDGHFIPQPEDVSETESEAFEAESMKPALEREKKRPAVEKPQHGPVVENDPLDNVIQG